MSTEDQLPNRVIDTVEAAGGVLLPAIRQLMREAWNEGNKQGGPMHDVNYDDPDAHTRNPYDATPNTPRSTTSLT